MLQPDDRILKGTFKTAIANKTKSTLQNNKQIKINQTEKNQKPGQTQEDKPSTSHTYHCEWSHKTHTHHFLMCHVFTGDACSRSW